MLRVDTSMVEALEDLRKKIASEIKDKYNLEEVKVYGTLASQVMAAAYKKKNVSFKISKDGLNKGIIEIGDCSIV